MKKSVLIAVVVILSLISGTAYGGDYAFSVSWQPAFCEMKPEKPECTTQTASRFDAANFTLHGLWPQEGEWCGVPSRAKKLDQQKRWKDLDPVSLPDELRNSLNEKMPGTASYLERHEWTRHGTCSGATPAEFFGRSLVLLDAINSSSLKKLVAGKIGASADLNELYACIEKDYGKAATNSVEFICANVGRKQYLVEIRYHLTSESFLPDTIAARNFGKPVRLAEEKDLCDAGQVYIDKAGH